MSAIWDTFKYGKENPFYSEPLQKGFYHPSPPRKLDRSLKQTLLNPDYSSADVPAEDGMRDSFLNVKDIYRMRRIGELGLFPDGESVSLNESWPQSERPSTISIPEIENLTPSPAWQPKGNISRTEREEYLRSELLNDEGKRNIQMESQESTLSKYINRFRNAQPLSREERKQLKSTDPEDFWWLRSAVPPPQTSPAESMREETNGLTLRPKLRSKELLANQTKRGKQSEREDLMLERTNSLLEKLSDQSLVSSQPAVSTIGLGSDSSGTVVTFDEEPFRPAFIQSRERSARALPATSRPEDDILYRYRLRRKRELAKEEAERRRMKSDSLHFVNQLPSSFKEPEAYSVLATKEKAPVEPSKPPETLIVQQLNGLPSTEAKRDAVIQTSDDFFNPRGTYVPIACPHVVKSGMVSVVGPHCHFNCDILSANHSSEDQRKPFRVSSKKKRGQNLDKILQFEGNVAAGENEILQDTGASETQSPSNTRSLPQGLHDEDSPTRITPLKTGSESSHHPKFCKGVVGRRHELSDTEVWQTTDNEEREKRLSLEAEDVRQDKKFVRHFQASRFTKVDSKFAGGEPSEHESDMHGSRIEQKKLKIPKKQSLKSVHSASGKAFVDQSMMTSVSSLDNFELSSLDLKESEQAVDFTEVDEPAHDTPTLDPYQPYLNSSADSVIFSDGEEFKDDDILCNLRDRRQSCIQRLKELDNFIQNFEKL